MSFRRATPADEDFFWQWREAAEAQPWYEGRGTTRAEHHAWFVDRLSRITMLVWERMDYGGPVGIVRIDSNGELAFEASHLLMPAMLRELLPHATYYGGRFKVTLDKDDKAKAKALKQAGFREYPVKFFCYRP